MRTSLVVAVMFPALALLAGCPVVPRSGVFSCARDGRCPDGLVCTSGLCVDPTGADAGSADDASLDAAPIVDAQADAAGLDAFEPQRDAGSQVDAFVAPSCPRAEPTGVVSARMNGTRSEDLFDLVVVSEDLSRPEILVPMTWDGSMSLSRSVSQDASLTDGAVLTLGDDLVPRMPLLTANGVGDESVRQVVPVGTERVIAGATTAGLRFSDGSADVGVSGPSAFVHVVDGATIVLGDLPATSHVTTYDLVALGDSRFCVSGVFLGALDAAHTSVAEAGFIACGSLLLDRLDVRVIDGDGDDGVAALAVGPSGEIYFAGTVTNGGVIPGDPGPVAMAPGAARAFVARTDASFASTQTVVFGPEATAGDTRKSTVHDVVALRDGVYFVGRLATGEDPGLPTVTNGYDAMVGRVLFVSGAAAPTIAWADTVDLGAKDQFFRVARDSCDNVVAVGGVGSSVAGPASEYSPIVGVHDPGGTVWWTEVGGAGAFLRGVAVLRDDTIVVGGRVFTAMSFFDRELGPPMGESDFFFLRLP